MDPKNKKEEEPSLKDKMKESFENLSKNEKVEEIYKYATANTRDTIAYILLITGILLLFFEPSYGGTLIGVIVGLYFAGEIYKLVVNYRKIIDNLGIVKSLILAGLLLAIFISLPMLFFGMAVAVALKQLLLPDK
jgi:hypothetical protein